MVEPPQFSARLDHLMLGCTIKEALSFYDSLPPAATKDVLGSWHGSQLPTRHRLGELMERLGWRGKRFESSEVVDPLVFADRRGRSVRLDPARVPVHLVLRLAPLLATRAAVALFVVVQPLLRTRRPAARVRMAEYRGHVTATMVYDRQPISDAFRLVDRDTLLGAMDLRGMTEPFLFVLRRADPFWAGGHEESA